VTNNHLPESWDRSEADEELARVLIEYLADVQGPRPPGPLRWGDPIISPELLAYVDEVLRRAGG
jgi:hypothetical protein